MKKLIAIFVFAAALATAQSYNSTVSATVITSADCHHQPRCKPGIVVTASTEDPSATAFAIRLTYFSGGDISELKPAGIDTDTRTATVAFYIPDPTLVAVEKVLAWPLVNPPGDLPAILNADPRRP